MTTNARRATWIVALAIAGLVLWAVFWQPRPSQIEFSGPVMGTTYTVKVVSAPRETGPVELKDRVEAALRQVDMLMSTYAADSELSRFNRHRGGDWFAVSAQTLAVVAAAREVSDLSGGAFDVTVGPLVNLWGFGPDGPVAEPPTAAAIARALESVGYAKLAVRADPPALRKTRDDIYVDLSAIAKGYAVDQAGAALEAAGVENYLIEVGGELLARGHRAGGDRWRVAVEKPATGERSAQRVLQLRDIAVATSGDYRNFFEIDGSRYSHTIDPRTGRPVPALLASVTVLAPTVMSADALATALLVMGPDAALEFARDQDIAALLIVRQGDVVEERPTPQLDRYLAAEPGDRQ